jgi:hypothetical protein
MYMKLADFARDLVGKPLYPYQSEIGEAILSSIRQGQGRTFSVMLARQMGKNQLSAMLEAYLLYHSEAGSIVKVAPTYQPQIANSYHRLLDMLENPVMRERTWRSQGSVIGLAAEAVKRGETHGPRVQFYSANPDASIVGATASLLLEVDEAQDVLHEKFDKDLRPMCSTTNATLTNFHLV